MNKKQLFTKLLGEGDYPELSKIKLLQDRILIVPDTAATKTAGGIIIPDGAKEEPKTGVIVAVGIGYTDKPMELTVGERIIFGKYAGTEVELDGRKFTMMREADVFATHGKLIDSE